MESSNDLTYWFWIDSIKGLGPLRIKRLLLVFGNDLRRVFELTRDQILSIKGIDDKIADGFIDSKSRFDQFAAVAARQRELAEKASGRMLHYLDTDYPQRLLSTTAGPPILYARGDMEHVLLDQPRTIAIVGTRRPTQAGLQVSERLASLLAQKGWAIVSGLAEGVDAGAHRGCLAVNGRTIAVLGCGTDVVYPPSSRELFDLILRSGLILSEYRFGTRPSEVTLKKRNKITVGLSEAVVVVETGETGGTWNAIRAAAEQKKKVFVLQPQESHSPSVQGNLKLISDRIGVPITLDNAEDIIAKELGLCL